MMSDPKSVKSFWLVFTIIVLLFSAIFISIRLYRSKDSLSSNNASADDSGLFPQIVNSPPLEAIIGEEFIFVPKVVAPSGFTNEYSLTLEGEPTWMVFSDGMVKGVPDKEGVASYTLKIVTKDASVDKDFYVNIVKTSADE